MGDLLESSRLARLTSPKADNIVLCGLAGCYRWYQSQYPAGSVGTREGVCSLRRVDCSTPALSGRTRVGGRCALGELPRWASYHERRGGQSFFLHRLG